MPRTTYQRLLVESLHATDRWEMQPATGCAITQTIGVDTVESGACVDWAAPACTESGSQYLTRYDTMTLGPERIVQPFRKPHS